MTDGTWLAKPQRSRKGWSATPREGQIGLLAKALRGAGHKAIDERIRTWSKVFAVLGAVVSLTTSCWHGTDRLLTRRLKEASKYCDEGLYEKALAILDQAEKKNPSCAEVYRLRAFVMYERSGGSDTGVVSQLDRALVLDPRCASAYALRGLVNAGCPQIAVADFTKAIQLEPHLKQAHVLRAVAYFEISNYVAAVRDATRAIELDPDDGDAFAARALGYVGQGRFKEAENDLGRAMALKPSGKFVQYARGEMARRRAEKGYESDTAGQ